MLRKIIQSALVLGLLLSWPPPGAQATLSRLHALGGSPDLLEDEAGITRWYGSLTDYPDHLVLDSGSFNIPDGYWMYADRKESGPAAGFTRHLDETGRWGTVGLFWQDLSTDRDPFLEDGRLRENIQVLYGRRLGPVDATLSYARGYWKVDEGEAVQDYHAQTFGLGLRLDLSDRAYLDLGADVRTTSHDAAMDADGHDLPDETIHDLRGRAFVGWTENTILVPVVEWVGEDRVHPFSALDDPRAASHRLLRLGMGLNHMRDTDNLLLLGVEFEDGRRHYVGYREDWQAWLLRGGFESRLSAWLSVRGGLTFIEQDVTTDLPATIDPWEWLNLEDPLLHVNLGAALHLGAVDLDLAFGERYPRRAFLGQVFEPQKHWLSASLRWLY